MSVSPTITFNLAGAGWADLVIEGDFGRHVVSGISYLSDALDDLLRLGIEVATDKGHGIARFYHEPGETVLFAEIGWWTDRTWTTGSRLSTIAGPGYGESEPGWHELHDRVREFLIEFGSRDALATAIRDAGQRVLEAHGCVGYSQRWNGRLGFPLRALAALDAALSVDSLPEENHAG